MFKILWGDQLNQYNKLQQFHKDSQWVSESFNREKTLSKIIALDNIYKDDLINFIEMTKVEVMPSIISKIDNDK